MNATSKGALTPMHETIEARASFQPPAPDDDSAGPDVVVDVGTDFGTLDAITETDVGGEGFAVSISAGPGWGCVCLSADISYGSWGVAGIDSVLPLEDAVKLRNALTAAIKMATDEA